MWVSRRTLVLDPTNVKTKAPAQAPHQYVPRDYFLVSDPSLLTAEYSVCSCSQFRVYI